jgi:WD40 repeat protein
MPSEFAAHSSSVVESKNQGTSRATPQAQSAIILLGHREKITALAFSPATDSTILASGCADGEIKLWDVINQVSIHTFNPELWRIETIFFSPGENVQCYVVTTQGPMIQIVRNKSMEFAATILETRPSLGEGPRGAFSPCGTCVAAIWPTFSGINSVLAMFDLRTMAKTQSVFLSGGGGIAVAPIAMSPDGKKLAATDSYGGTHLFECHDLTIQKYVDTIEEKRPDEEPRRFWSVEEPRRFWPVAFDPTSRLFAVGCGNGRVVLRTP